MKHFRFSIIFSIICLAISAYWGFTHGPQAGLMAMFKVLAITAILAVMVGADAYWTGVVIWIMALARVLHMVLYYAIATDKNPSPRSYFYLIAVLANIALLGLCAFALI